MQGKWSQITKKWLIVLYKSASAVVSDQINKVIRKQK